jgi:hypothetical protein
MDDIIEINMRIRDGSFRNLYKIKLKNTYDKDMMKIIEIYSKFRGTEIFNMLKQKLGITNWI